jgi:Glycosyltransferase like family 2
MTRTYAPVVLFCFNRPRHLARTIDSLIACPEFGSSELFVYVDGPRNAADNQAVAAVRDVLASRLPETATVVARPSNVGLARNIVEGVDALCASHGRVIVIEDDLLLDRRFLTFMNDALDRYCDEPRVYQVAGHTFETPAFSRGEDAVLLPWPTSWGWATWKRAWAHFDPRATGWEELARDRSLRRRFNLDNAYDYATMLERQMGGFIQSWAVRWYWTLFRADALAVYPPFTLVENAGFDGTGTHGRGWLRRVRRSAPQPTASGRIHLPWPVTLDERIRLHARNAIWTYNGGWIGYLADRVRRPLGKLRQRMRRCA